MAADPAASAAVLTWYAATFSSTPAASPSRVLPGPRPPDALPLSDHELLERARAARNGLRFSRLWDGDCSLHGGDHSRADAALVAHLFWWTGGDAARTDSLFRRSRLYRDKWDRRHYADGRTYGEGTIAHVGALGRVR